MRNTCPWYFINLIQQMEWARIKSKDSEEELKGIEDEIARMFDNIVECIFAYEEF
jgi:hypothetical protein